MPTRALLTRSTGRPAHSPTAATSCAPLPPTSQGHADLGDGERRRRQRARTHGVAERPPRGSPRAPHLEEPIRLGLFPRGRPARDGDRLPGWGESLVDRGLFNGTVYTYRFTALDLAGNISTTTSVRVKPRGRLLSPRDGGVIRVAPVLEWAKVTRAPYYNVQLWRNGRKILSRWPTRPSYELRTRWRYGGRVRALRDGTYLWYVWPGFGDRERGRYGRMLGSATFFKR